MSKHVAVLKGGWSSEREVSLASGAAVEKALAALGYRVSAVDMQPDVAEVLAKLKPDVVFNALHGRPGEDGTVQGMLELLGIPYTHSGVLASALAMDKPMAKQLFAAAGIPVADGKVVHKHEMMAGEPMPRPYVIKPINEGSSVGVTIVMENDNIFFDENNWPFGEYVLVEHYIAGREIQVAVLDGEALGAIEIRAKGRFYDYNAKYTDGQAEHLMPAPIDAAAYARVCALAVKAHEVLGCRGLTRSDFRYEEMDGSTGMFYILETNTQPGMTPLSLSPEIAAHHGIPFDELIDRLVKGAAMDSAAAGSPVRRQANG